MDRNWTKIIEQNNKTEHTLRRVTNSKKKLFLTLLT